MRHPSESQGPADTEHASALDLALASLRAAPGHFDELRERMSTGGMSPQDAADADNDAMAHDWHEFFRLADTDGLGDMNLRAETLARQIRDNGVTYNVYADEGGPQRPWSLGLFPLIISPDSWQHIEAGITQRVRLLDRVMADVYGAQDLLAQGLLAPALV